MTRDLLASPWPEDPLEPCLVMAVIMGVIVWFTFSLVNFADLFWDMDLGYTEWEREQRRHGSSPQ